ncbi:MAG: PAS domain-containing protein [Planctomycetes bacterium]|nr:PAS domain-containing protein [Planctomycetota bacterium]
MSLFERVDAAVVEHVLDLMPAAVYGCAADGRIQFFNRRATELWGRTPRLGDPDSRFCGAMRLRDATGRLVPHPESLMAQALRTGQGFRDQEVLIDRPDGSQVTVLVSIGPIRGEGGAVLGAVNVFEDVTARRRAAQALRESEAQLRFVLDHTSALLARCGADLRFRFVNQAYAGRFGLTPDEVIGRPVAEVLGQEAFAAIRPYVERVLAGEAVEYEVEIPYARLGTKVMRCSYAPERDAQGQVVGWVSVVQDATDERRAREALREAGRRKDEFLATLAHELRNPLAPTLHAIELLRLGGEDRALRERACSTLERQVLQMSRIVDDLLDLSRITRGKIELRPERVDLAAVLASAVETSLPLIRAAGQRLEVAPPPGPLFMEVDAARLAQVVANLLNNSARYADRGGRVWLSAARDADAVAIEVRDDGPGMDEETLARLFEPFFQGPRAGHVAPGGLGIGLTLVRTLVALHGGAVEARSDGPGRGSAVIVRLPAHLVRDDAGPAPAALHAGSARRRVAVVDDNVDAAEMLATLLRLRGHEVTLAHDGPSALALLEVARAEVVVLDIGMPGMDGYEVARELRRRPAYSGALLVALTGWGQEEDRRRSREAGFDHHLVKPVAPEELDRILEARVLPPGVA